MSDNEFEPEENFDEEEEEEDEEEVEELEDMEDMDDGSIAPLEVDDEENIPINDSNRTDSRMYRLYNLQNNATTESDIYSSYAQKDEDSTTYLDVILMKLDSREKQMILEVS